MTTRFLGSIGAISLLAGIIFYPQHSAIAADYCKGVDTKLTTQRKSDYAMLVARSLDQNVKPSQINIKDFMQSGTWTVVFAEVSLADPGYFFFDSSSGTPVFKEVWDGIAGKDEIPEITKWARELGANNTIASCFAQTVAVAE